MSLLDRLLLWLLPRTARGAPGWRELVNGQYLTALARLGREYVSQEQTPMAHNFLMWLLNSVDPWGAEAWGFAVGRERPQHANDLVSVEAVAEAFEKHRVVVLQERHAAPETRYFGILMLKSLAKAGATHLAFEHSFQPTLTEFARTGIVRPSTEVYAFDPSRAALLRSARDLGLEIIAFDFPPEGHLMSTVARVSRQKPADAPAINRQRERDMAENIVRLIVEPNPLARVVVWTGEQHAMKKTPDGWWGPFMAANLGELMEQQPFCVGQELVDWPQLIASPQLLVGDHPWLEERGLDAMVLHHRGAAPSRPPWTTAETTAVDLDSDGIDLVQAIPVAEGDRAVPTVQQLTHGAQSVKLHLPVGTYLLRALRGEDELVWQREISTSAS